jgi:hypothetical protein
VKIDESRLVAMDEMSEFEAEIEPWREPRAVAGFFWDRHAPLVVAAVLVLAMIALIRSEGVGGYALQPA